MLPIIPSTIDLSIQTLIVESFAIAGLKNFDTSALPPTQVTKHDPFLLEVGQQTPHIAVDAVQPSGSSYDLVATAC